MQISNHRSPFERSSWDRQTHARILYCRIIVYYHFNLLITIKRVNYSIYESDGGMNDDEVLASLI